MIIINSAKDPADLAIPPQAGDLAIIDATDISERLLGRNIPNTAMLGAFAKATGLVDTDLLVKAIEESFGGKNVDAAKEAYDNVKIIKKGEY